MSKNNVREVSTLKSLQTQLQKLEGEYGSLQLQQNQLNNSIQFKKKQIKETENKIKELKNQTKKELIVSEHALIRYFERVEGININEIIQKISTDKLKTMVNTLGNGTFPIDGNFSVKVHNNVIITVIT